MKIVCFGLLAVVGGFFCLVLPPRQTADVVGLCCTLLGQLAASAALLWLEGQPCPSLLFSVGWRVTLTLYWLATLGLTLVFRLLALTQWELLVFLQLLAVVCAGLALWLFYYARGLDDAGKGEGQQ